MIQVPQKCVIGAILILPFLQIKRIKFPQKTDSSPLFQRKYQVCFCDCLFKCHYLTKLSLVSKVKIQVEAHFYDLIDDENKMQTKNI